MVCNILYSRGREMDHFPSAPVCQFISHKPLVANAASKLKLEAGKLGPGLPREVRDPTAWPSAAVSQGLHWQQAGVRSRKQASLCTLVRSDATGVLTAWPSDYLKTPFLNSKSVYNMQRSKYRNVKSALSSSLKPYFWESLLFGLLGKNNLINSEFLRYVYCHVQHCFSPEIRELLSIPVFLSNSASALSMSQLRKYWYYSAENAVQWSSRWWDEARGVFMLVLAHSRQMQG